MKYNKTSSHKVAKTVASKYMFCWFLCFIVFMY